MDDMQKNIIIVSVGILAVTAVGLYVSAKSATTTEDENVVEKKLQDAPRGKIMSVEAYVTQNISTLSPAKETMGGTFYVTEIEVEPENKTGSVKYEDGHNAFVADFSYTASDRTGISIDSFVIRQ